ncbi:MAG: hypothetical protein WCX93_04800 [Burkholderiaceae bacterium]
MAVSSLSATARCDAIPERLLNLDTAVEPYEVRISLALEGLYRNALAAVT